MTSHNYTRFTAGLFGALVLVGAARADEKADLRREVARLQAELVSARAACTPTTSTNVSMQRIDGLAFSIASLRVGPASNWAKGHIAVTLTIDIRNERRDALALNYNLGTFSLVDDKGYRYQINASNSIGTPNTSEKFVSGIAVAGKTKASTHSQLSPGGMQRVTITAIRYMRDGESPGSRFDTNITFGQYQDEGEGRIKHVRDFNVGFVNVKP